MLYCLTAADYSTGDFYHYTYDGVGNRLTQESMVHGLSSTVNYNYDIANRLTDVGGVPYVYDANGNLLNDGVNTYAYDSANQLISVSGQSTVSSYQYNGLGDRLSQTVDGQVTNYTLDLNAGLTQVLDDGTTSYTYGLGRISQQSGSPAEYFLGDALGSVRQLMNGNGEITLAKSYDPYGKVTGNMGNSASMYAYTGEQQQGDMVYLRSRYYNVADGRFQSRDTWGGDYNSPVTLNRWAYANANPVNLIDLSGRAAGVLDPNGYAEGKINTQTGLFVNWHISGEELVYNFETLERAKFSTTARIDPSTGQENWIAGGCTSVVNIGGATYTSVIFGFDHDDGIVEDFGGPFKSVSGGASFPIITLGTGTIFFSSVDRGTNSINWDVTGFSAYQEFGIGFSLLAVLEVGGATTESTLTGIVKRYNNIDEMAQDILKGEGSPIHTFIGLQKVREWAVEQARHYREIRE